MAVEMPDAANGLGRLSPSSQPFPRGTSEKGSTSELEHWGFNSGLRRGGSQLSLGNALVGQHGRPSPNEGAALSTARPKESSCPPFRA